MTRLAPVILCGGSGTRLWPLSRTAAPKPFQAVTGAESLLDTTLRRVAGLADAAPPTIVCADEQRFLAAEALRRAALPADGTVLLEPHPRDTAMAAGAAAHRLPGDALCLLLPADHHIDDPEAFRAAVTAATPIAHAGWLVCFGVPPTAPATGYGYIRRGRVLDENAGVVAAERFVEKPDAETAAAYLADGGYLWNAGVVLARAGVLRTELAAHAPAIALAAAEAARFAAADGPFQRLHPDSYGDAPARSLDHAVMERTDRAAVVAMDAGWTDVGNWRAVHALQDRDTDGNALAGDAVAEQCTGCLLHSEHRLVAAVGLSDVAVVETADAVLVASLAHAQAVGPLVRRLAAAGHPEAHSHPTVHRPWGRYTWVDRGEGFAVKRLTIAPGAALSLQRHAHRAEHWIVVAGEAAVTRDGTVHRLGANEATYIPERSVHRLANPAATPLHVIEVQRGDPLTEADIERLAPAIAPDGEEA